MLFSHATHPTAPQAIAMTAISHSVDFAKRRSTLASAALMLCAFASPLVPSMALASDWAPTKPVKIIVPIVGSTNDTLARLLAPKLQEALGQPVIVENKPGAGSNVGADFAAKSVPDEHTILIGYNGPLAVNALM